MASVQVGSLTQFTRGATEVVISEHTAQRTGRRSCCAKMQEAGGCSAALTALSPLEAAHSIRLGMQSSLKQRVCDGATREAHVIASAPLHSWHIVAVAMTSAVAATERERERLNSVTVLLIAYRVLVIAENGPGGWGGGALCTDTTSPCTLSCH